MSRQHGGENPFRARFGTSKARFRFIDHHLAHAISAYRVLRISKMPPSWFSMAAARGKPLRFGTDATDDSNIIWTIPWPNSLGLFYAQFTQFLGFTPYSDEWKVMGLAPYGEPGINLREFIVPDDNPYRVATRLLIGPRFGPSRRNRCARLGPRRVPESEIDPRHKNLAFAVQDSCEQAMLTLARAAVEKTRCRNLCLAGGVALNSKANGKILSSGIVDRIFVQPAASDDGTCLGAALGPSLDGGGHLPSAKCATPIWEMNIPTRRSKRRCEHTNCECTRVADPANTRRGIARRWENSRLVSGPHGIWPASSRAPLDPRRSARS